MTDEFVDAVGLGRVHGRRGVAHVLRALEHAEGQRGQEVAGRDKTGYWAQLEPRLLWWSKGMENHNEKHINNNNDNNNKIKNNNNNNTMTAGVITMITKTKTLDSTVFSLDG